MVNIVGKEVDVTYLISENRGVDGKLKSKPTIVKKFGEPRDCVISTAESYPIPPDITHIIIDGKKYATLGHAYSLGLINSELMVSYTKENDIGKEECEKRLGELVKEWKAQTIESSPRLSAWCKLNDKKPEDVDLLDTNPAEVRANAYDMVINGVEVGGGSIRIHDSQLQAKIFKILGFTEEKAQEQFGFLMNAFKYGAPPHGGLAYGLDRWVSLFAGLDSIRDCIAFPKNNQGRDVMLDAPGKIDQKQLDELCLALNLPNDKE